MESFLANIEVANSNQLDLAVTSARKAQNSWVKLGGHKRAKVLYALARLIQKHSRLISVLESLDNGKPIRESRDIDIPLAIRHFYHHAGWAQLQEKSFQVIKLLVLWHKLFLGTFHYLCFLEDCTCNSYGKYDCF